MAGDRYRIKHIVGEGASGTVYRAVDSTDGKEVAIKMHSGGSDGFEHEREMLGRLEHEHVVRLYGEDGRSGMLVLELCDYNLISFMNEHELDTRCIKRIMRMVLLGLRHMHERGIIHRDIKLGNVLVKGDSIKLCDLGLSCLKAQNDFSYCGTRDYLAPEMEKGKRVYDEKIDVFAAGIICRTLVTRRKGVDVDTVRTDPGVADLLRNMLDPDPKRRCSAEQALMHKAFDSIFPEIPDFRAIRSFSKSTRHGVIEKGQGHIQIQYEDGQVLRIEVAEDGDVRSAAHFCGTRWEPSSSGCRCMQSPSYRVVANGKCVCERFLAETELKHHVFLCSYFRIIAEKTVKVRLEEDGHVFTVTANNTKILEHKDYRVAKTSRGLWEVCENKQGSGNTQGIVDPHLVPRSIGTVFAFFESKAMNTPHKCFFQQVGLESCSSMSFPALNDPLVREYVFAQDIGWCIKNRLRFTILLNNGTRFDLHADEQVVVTCDHKRIGIGRGVPEYCKDLLRISRVFIRKFA